MEEKKKRSGAVIGGWVCFVLGVVLMFASLWSFILYAPLFLASFVLAIVAMAKGRVGQGLVMLIASILVPFVLFFALGATRTADFAKQVKEQPARKAAAAADASPNDVVKVSAEGLYQAYEANEVATDARLKGHIVEVTGIVDSINKDAFDDVVIELRTGNDFEHASMEMADSEAGTAAQLRKGQRVTVRCASMKRMIGSPYGSDCVFASQ